MRPHSILEQPAVYRLKTRLLSLGRRSVYSYLASIAASLPEGPVLDAACGTGAHVPAFSQTVFGFDTNPRYLEYARVHSPGRFCAMDAAQLGFPENTFALAFAVGLCHHLPDAAVRHVAREMKRVTGPGGRVLIIEGVYPPYRLHPGGLLFRLDRGAYTRTAEHIGRLLHKEGLVCAVSNLPHSFPYHRAVFSFDKPA